MTVLIKSQIPKDCTLIIMGCMHSGAANCHWDGIHTMVDRIGDKEVFGVLNTGDNVECKVPGNKHFSKASIDVERGIVTPKEQADALIKVLSPIQSKLLAWGCGNHEDKVINTFDVGGYIAEQLGAPYGLYSYKFHAMDKRNKTQFKIHIHHGYGKLASNAKDTIQRKANKEASLRQRYFGTGISDCILHAGSHWHQQIISPPSYTLEKHVTDDGKKITLYKRKPTPQNEEYISPEQRWVASVGCFRKSFTDPGDMLNDYAEVGMYSGAADLGWVEVRIEDYRIVDVKAVEC